MNELVFCSVLFIYNFITKQDLTVAHLNLGKDLLHKVTYVMYMFLTLQIIRVNLYIVS